MRRKPNHPPEPRAGLATRDLGLLLGAVGLALPLWAAESASEAESQDGRRRPVAVAGISNTALKAARPAQQQGEVWLVAANTPLDGTGKPSALSKSTRSIGTAVAQLARPPARPARADESWTVAANTPARTTGNGTARTTANTTTNTTAGSAANSTARRQLIAQAVAPAAAPAPAAAGGNDESWTVAANTAPARPPTASARPRSSPGVLVAALTQPRRPETDAESWVVAANVPPVRAADSRAAERSAASRTTGSSASSSGAADPPAPDPRAADIQIAQAGPAPRVAASPAAPEGEHWVVAVNTLPPPPSPQSPRAGAGSGAAARGRSFDSAAGSESWVVAANTAAPVQNSASTARRPELLAANTPAQPAMPALATAPLRSPQPPSSPAQTTVVAQATTPPPPRERTAASMPEPAPGPLPAPAPADDPASMPASAPAPAPAPAPQRESELLALNTPRPRREDAAAAVAAPRNDPAQQSWTVAANVVRRDDELARPRYNVAFLHGSAQGVDVEELIATKDVVPGTYQVDVLINRQLASRREIVFARSPKTGKVEACISLQLLEELGVDMSKLPQDISNPDDKTACRLLPELIEQASVNYDQQRLRLEISVPQASMLYSRRGFVDRALWDSGVPVGFVNYNASGRHDTGGFAGSNTSVNVGLRNGLNFGGWRLRNSANVSGGSGRSADFTNGDTQLMRDVAALDSQLVMGETYTNTQLFDSVRFLGAQMYSDEAMLPDSARGYAPVIRGTAESNATVEIRQNGFLLLSTNVAPGPFVIDDLMPAGSNGDLEITVIEADGRRRVTRQAFATAPLMVREGRMVYATSVGKIDSYYAQLSDPYYWSGEAIYGLNNDVSLRGGLQMSRGYQSVAFGTGVNTRIGAVSLDLLHSSSKTDDRGGQSNDNTGQALRLRYGRLFEETKTTLTVSAQHYLGEGFRTLNDHLSDENSALLYGHGWSNGRSRLSSSLDLGLSSQVGEGNVYLSASGQRYSNGTDSQSVSAGYSNRWGRIGYSVSLSHGRQVGGDFAGAGSRNSTQVNFSIAVPLGSSPQAPYATASVSHDSTGTTVQSGLSGMVEGDLNLSYSAQAGRSSNGDYTGSAGMSARLPVANVSAGYSYGGGTNSLSFGGYGSIVAHEGGINLGQQVGETFALARVEPPLAGVAIRNHTGATTGWNGYAVVPYVQPYRVNWVGLDPTRLGSEVEIEDSIQQTVPTRGSATLSTFKVSSGRRVQFELRRADGSAVPFGTVIEDEKGERLGMADPSGRVLALLQAERGSLRLRWNGTQCLVPFELPEAVDGENYQRLRLQCIEEVKHASVREPRKVAVE